VGFLTLNLADIKVPTLILWGDRDRVLSPDNAKVFNRYIPGSRLQYFTGVGHVPMAEVPEQSAQAVTTFIDSLSAGK
jgi:pimeloyl-ACP methyl ester carboxylesterase